MKPPESTYGRAVVHRRELAVLAAGTVSAAALIGAAFLTGGDPQLLGQATMSRVAGDVADGLVAEWERIDRTGVLLDGPDALRWRNQPAPLPATLDLVAAREPSHPAFDLLAAEATRLESVGEHAAAVGLLEDALSKTHDASRAAEAQVSLIRATARLGDADRVRRAWSDLVIAVDGLDARGDTAYLMLGALAALPALEPERRGPVLQHVTGLWSRDLLALPDDVDGEASPMRAAYLRELARHGTVPAAVAEAEQRHRVRALLESLGGELPPSDASAGVTLIPLGDQLLLHSVEDGEHFARRTNRDQIAAVLREAADKNDLLPEGFVVDFGDETRGTVVRPRVDLAGPAFGFALRHENPEALAEAEGVRLAFLQGGLVVMALLVAAASAMTWRMLRRERLLAGLKSSFIANVSHELRTPLSSILLMAENLVEKRVQGDAAQLRYHQLIRREAQRLRRLVDDVLDFSRIDRGDRPRLRTEDLDVAVLLTTLEEEARERVESEEGTLAFHVNGVPDKMHADGEALRRAAMNLVDNAMKHSGSHAIEIDADVDGNAFVLGVRDHGIGVPAERRVEVFAPFARIESDADGEPSGQAGATGTGLGLAIVREIAMAHGGARDRACARGRSGSRLRAVDSAGGQVMTPAALRVLLVEDEEPLRMALADALRAEGFEVLEAADGERGLELALAEGPDVVLLDLMLPRRDGFSVLRAIREDRLTSAVIILSARGEEWDRVQGFEYGADDYVVKPFSTRELVLRMRAVLNRADGRTPGLEAEGGRLRVGDALIDFAAYTVTRNGTRQGLSRRELDLLRYLIEHDGETLGRDRLLEDVWGATSSPPRARSTPTS